MRVVLDTNVLVSGILNPHGPPGRVVDLVFAGEIVLLVDDRILHEYAEVLRRRRFEFPAADIAAILAYLRSTAEAVVAPPLDVRLPDPDDLPFLEVALAGRADALVTGNRRDFMTQQIGGAARVLTPREVLDLIR